LFKNPQARIDRCITESTTELHELMHICSFVVKGRREECPIDLISPSEERVKEGKEDEVGQQGTEGYK